MESLLGPEDEKILKKMGQFSVIAPTASPLDLSNPEVCFR